MGFIVLTLAILILGIALLFFKKGAPPKVRRGLNTTVGVLIAVWLVFLAFASTIIVGARSVAIMTTLGRYDYTAKSGLHAKWPITGDEEFKTFVQTLYLSGEEGKDDQRGPTDVKFNGGGTGSIDVSVRWTINSSNAKALWEGYRSFDKVQRDLVESSSREAIKVAVGGYTATEAQSGENIGTIIDKVLTNLQAKLGPRGIVVDSASVTGGPTLSPDTQASIEKVIQAKKDLERAQVDQERAKVEKTTIETQQRSGALTDGALRRLCLTIVAGWDANKSGPLPATWNCVVDSSGNGVIVAPPDATTRKNG